jgi:23S rRNA (pseudouridine1915-N3)-methyltransferase
MKLTIIAVGHKMPAWIQAGFEQYAKRMSAEARIELIELKPGERAGKAIAKVLDEERMRIDAALPRDALQLVLDEHGEMISTKQLSQWLADWMRDGSKPCFIIGSADGLADGIKRAAHKTITLSACTLPHGLVRVMLAEQLYRAWSLLNNHPYHRE